MSFGKTFSVPNYEASAQPVTKIGTGNVHREYRRWRKSDSYQEWVKRQISKQNYMCFYCRETLQGRRMNVEHIRPRSKGGTNDHSNLVLACADCNKEKGSKLLSKGEVQEIRKRFNKRRRAVRRQWRDEVHGQDELAMWLKSWID